MRLIFWGRAQVLIPLAAVFQMNGIRVGLLVGGLTREDGQFILDDFRDNSNGILLCTKAWEHGWRLDVEAVHVELEGSFVDMNQAGARTRFPIFPPPTSEDFLNWYFRRGEYKEKESPIKRVYEIKALPAPEPKVRKRRKPKAWKEPPQC